MPAQTVRPPLTHALLSVRAHCQWGATDQELWHAPA